MDAVRAVRHPVTGRPGQSLAMTTTPLKSPPSMTSGRQELGARDPRPPARRWSSPRPRFPGVQRTFELGGESFGVIACAHEQQRPSHAVFGCGEFLALPFDTEQALVEHAIPPGGRRRGAEPGSAQESSTAPSSSNNRDLPDLAARVEVDQSRIAVVGVPSRPVHPQFTHAERNRQLTVTYRPHLGMRVHGLEARIEQSRMDAVGALLRADGTRQPTSATTVDRSPRGVHRSQPGERRTVLQAAIGEPGTEFVAVHPGGVGCQSSSMS